jgi:DNA-binding protein HU-beta
MSKTKEEFIRAMLDQMKSETKHENLTLGDANAAFNAFIDGVSAALAAGEDVQLRGFGTFKPVKMKARAGRNIQTGEAIKIPARTVVRFHAGKALAEAAAKGGKKRKTAKK